MPDVTRRLMFSAWADGSQRVPFDRISAAEAINELEEDEIVLEHGEALTAVEVLQVGTSSQPTCLRLLALRDYENRPSVWAPGVGATPITIAGDHYTADLTHVALWSDKIAAHDVYSSAPGIGRLSSYLRDKVDQRVIFRALYEPNLAHRLRDLRGLRRIEYGLHTPHKVQQMEARGLLGSLLPEAFGRRAPSIRVSLGMGRRGPRDAYLDQELSEEVLNVAEHAEQFFDSLTISGKSRTQTTAAGNPKTIQINLLSQRLHVQTSIPRSPDGGNVPEGNAIYEALRAARRTLDESATLERAVEGRLALQQALIPPDSD